MKKYDLLSEIRRHRKWQQIHKYKNLLNREFRADKPNSKQVTDIPYIAAPLLYVFSGAAHKFDRLFFSHLYWGY